PLPSCLASDAVQRRAHPTIGSLGAGHGARQESTGQVVATLGEAYLEVDAGSAVELGWAARARAGAPGGTPVFRVEEAVAYEPVEVEFRDMVRDSDSDRGLLATDRRPLSDNEPIERASNRFAQGGDAVESGVQVGAHVGL